MAGGNSRLSYPHETTPDAGTTREVAPGVHWLRMPLPFPPDHINLWLLADGPKDAPTSWTIVDTGLARDEIKANWEQIFATTLAGKPVSRVIVTHFHPDHMGLAAWLCQRWNAPLWTTAGEWYMARSVHSNGSPADVATRVAFYRANGVSEQMIGPFAESHNLYRRHVPDVPPLFRRITGGVPVEIGGHAWLPVIGRGHAPEHACLWCPELNVLIGGDILLPRISPNVSVWPNEPLANPLRDYLDCLGNFSPVPAETLILPAHGLPYRGLHARIADLRTHHAERLDALVAALDPPRAATECFGLLFKREIGPNNMGLAVGEALAHLHYLEWEGRVRREHGADGVWRFARVN
jgi:glyoxylase-like metal-dependent hydrolase (beta-lactamase superfamily II)